MHLNKCKTWGESWIQNTAAVGYSRYRTDTVGYRRIQEIQNRYRTTDSAGYRRYRTRGYRRYRTETDGYRRYRTDTGDTEQIQEIQNRYRIYRTDTEGYRR